MHKSHGSFYLTTALHISGVTITHFRSTKQPQLQHLVPVTVTRCCSYSCFVLLKMGDSDARNM